MRSRLPVLSRYFHFLVLLVLLVLLVFFGSHGIAWIARDMDRINLGGSLRSIWLLFLEIMVPTGFCSPGSLGSLGFLGYLDIS